MAKVTNKPRIHSVAKELDINNKELIELLEKYGLGTKNHMSTLTAEDMDVIFDYYTQKFDDGTPIEDFLSSGKKEEPKKPEKEEKATTKKAKKGEKAEPEKKAVAGEDEKAEEEVSSKIEKRESRYVDTRQNVVDLEKIDTTERIEKMVEGTIKDDEESGKQKIKKRPQLGEI